MINNDNLRNLPWCILPPASSVGAILLRLQVHRNTPVHRKLTLDSLKGGQL
jgi:hypothetical protein